MIAKGYKVYSWKLCQSKNGVYDESPPKRQTVAETFAWRLIFVFTFYVDDNMQFFLFCYLLTLDKSVAKWYLNETCDLL